MDQALKEAGIDRSQVYVTNAVKHFKVGTSRETRISSETKLARDRSLRPWLEAELRIVGPKLVVAMGATAAQTIRPLVSRYRETRKSAFV